MPRMQINVVYVLNGEINVDEQATIRIVDMLIQQPQKKEEDENDS